LLLFFRKEEPPFHFPARTQAVKDVSAMLHQGLAFKGFSIEATDGKIGTVSDFLFDDTTWKLRWLVVDTGNWLNDRKVLLHPSAIDKPDGPAQALLVNLTRDQVEKSPAIATDEPVSQQMEYRLYGYYGVDPLWGGAYYGGNAIAKPMAAPNFAGADLASAEAGGTLHDGHGPGDRHLRSLAEVTGYNIHATDGEMGHLENFLIDDQGWDIRYLVADTRNWWFGRHVLLSPAAVRSIEWDLHRVNLNLTCYKIKGSPVWDATGLLDRAYEQVLQAYYAWPAKFLPVKHDGAVPAAAPVQVEASL
jgi:uncharacterized protein YrrD